LKVFDTSPFRSVLPKGRSLSSAVASKALSIRWFSIFPPAFAIASLARCLSESRILVRLFNQKSILSPLINYKALDILTIAALLRYKVLVGRNFQNAPSSNFLYTFRGFRVYRLSRALSFAHRCLFVCSFDRRPLLSLRLAHELPLGHRR
jgi:hypothetical protein